MHVAIGQRQGTDAVGDLRCQDLRDRPAAVIPNEIDFPDAERVDELAQHLRLGVEAQTLIRRHLRKPQTHKVRSDAAADVAQAFNLVAPVEAIERKAVHEQGDRAAP